jgi:acetyl-CoA carboxylase carboxyl transferase subunit beta
MSWFGKRKASVEGQKKKTLGRGVFRKCDRCGETLPVEEFTANLEVCPGCGNHFRISAESRLDLLLDPDTYKEYDADLSSKDPLSFVDSKSYADRIVASMRKTGVNDALTAGEGQLLGRRLQIAVFMFQFMGGSMGSVVGEKLTRTFERAAEQKQPVIFAMPECLSSVCFSIQRRVGSPQVLPFSEM